MIRAEGLVLAARRGGRALFDGLDLAVAGGETLAILGDSGAGKTTLLRALAALVPFDRGRVVVGENVIGPDDARRESPLVLRVRRRLGVVFQGLHLFPHRTALENVAEGPRFVRGLPRDDAEARARRWLARVSAEHLAGARPRALSGGEQQRVAIARALALEPDALLLDEPTSALDPGRRDALGALLAEVAAGGTAVVVVTHDHDFAKRFAKRRLALEGGRLVDAAG